MATLPPLRRRSVLRYALGVVVLLGLLVSWRVWQVRGDLLQARDYAEALRAAGDERDLPDARVALRELRRHAGDAADGTSGPSWWLVERLPVIGDDARAIATMSDALSTLADAADPLLRIADDVDRGRVEISGGRVPLDVVRSYQEPVSKAASAADAAEREVRSLDGSYVGPISAARTDAIAVLERAAGALDGASKAVELLPALLGADGPRSYLLVQQNNAEIRSTGGFPGSTFLLTARDGRLRVVKPVATRKFPHLSRPVLPLSAGERRLFGERVGTWFVDANKIPDSERAAELWAAHWRARFGQRLDGVLSLDPVTLSYLMRATGPVKVPGVTLDSGNVVQQLLSGTYQRYADPDAQDEFFREVGRRIFAAVETPRDPIELALGLRQGIEEDRVQFTSFRASEQQMLRGTALAGPSLEDDVPGVYLSDTTGRYGSKLSFYLRYRASLASTCPVAGEGQGAALDLRLETPADPSRLPAYVTGGDATVPPGAEDLEIVLVGVRSGAISDVRLNGRPVEHRTATLSGRPAVRVVFRLQPGAEARLTWHLRAPRPFPALRVTPSVVPGSAEVEAPATGC